MMQFSTEIIIFLAALGFSLISGFVGGVFSFLSMSTLMALGIPAHMSLSILRFGNATSKVGGFITYLKNGSIVWKYVLPSILVVIPSSIIGAFLALSVDAAIFNWIIKVFLIASIPLLFIKKNFGVEAVEVSKTRRRWGYLVYALINFWISIFPFGAGIFVAYHHIHFWGMTIIQMKGTGRIAGFVSNVISLAVFIAGGIINWELSIIFALGALIGSYLSAKYAVKLGNQKLKYFIALTIVILVVRSFF